MLQPSRPALHSVSLYFSLALVLLRYYSHHALLYTMFFVFQLALGLVEMLQPSHPALHCVSLRVSPGSWSCRDVKAITPRFTLCLYVFQLGLGLVEMLQPSRPALHSVSLCFSLVLVLLRCYSHHALLYTMFFVFQLGLGLVEMLQPSRPALHCVFLCVLAGSWSC